MAAMQSLCSLVGINNRKLSKSEFYIIEAELLFSICNELKGYFNEQFKNYHYQLNFSMDAENNMFEPQLTKLIIKDILLTNEYTVEGLAYYIGVHSDIIHDIITGLNINPSAVLLQRVIDLHRTVRREIYREAMKKILMEYQKEVECSDSN